MVQNLLDPIVLFFLVGLLAGILKSDLKLPESIYDILSIYLLLAIGLKGGVQLSHTSFVVLAIPAIATVALGVVIPVIAFVILKNLGRMNPSNAGAIAAHYGSVSAVTFAVVLTYLSSLGVTYEEYVTVLLVILEVPGIAVGIMLAQKQASAGTVRWGHILREVFIGKSLFLLLAGLLVGFIAGPDGIRPLTTVFVDPFKGALAFFLLELGLVTSRRLNDLKKVGPFLIAFGIGMPVISAALAVVTGWLAGLSPGGTAVLATLAASASYIAAPAAVRIALPQANPTFYLTASLGVTFPFNLVVGIPLYHWMALTMHGA